MHVRFRAALTVLSSTLILAACNEGNDPTDLVDDVMIETESLPEAIEGEAYSQTLEASGGSGGYSWAVSAGSLPAGVTIDPAGVLLGTPIAPGTASFELRATDSDENSATADFTISVVQALAVHTGSLADAVVGEAYSAQLVSVGGRGIRTWSITGGEAGSWLEISEGGTLSGTPTAADESSVTVAVADESGQESIRDLAIVVLDPVAVAEISLPTGTQGRAYAAQLVATGGDGSYTWSVESGTLPAGMSLSSGGALTGTPTEGGTFEFTVEVADGAERTATRSLSLTVELAPTIVTTSLAPGDVGEPYEAELTATGGTGAYSWSLTDGSLPAGLTLSATGVISGTPTTAGSATFTVQVEDEAGIIHERELTIVVAEISALTSGVGVTGLAGDSASVRYYGIEVPTGASQLTVSVSGGTGDVDLYLRQGQLPQEFAYDCRPLREGNDETCTVTAPAAGYWYVMLRGFAEYTDVTLVATVED